MLVWTAYYCTVTPVHRVGNGKHSASIPPCQAKDLSKIPPSWVSPKWRDFRTPTSRLSASVRCADQLESRTTNFPRITDRSFEGWASRGCTREFRAVFQMPNPTPNTSFIPFLNPQYRELTEGSLSVRYFKAQASINPSTPDLEGSFYRVSETSEPGYAILPPIQTSSVGLGFRYLSISIEKKKEGV